MIWGKTLSFREQLAISVASRSHAPSPARGTSPCFEGHGGLTELEIAQSIQRFAEACCESWGHDDQPYAPPEVGSATIAAPEGQRPAHVLCARCGRRASR